MGFYTWMVRRHGDPVYSCGAWEWRVNGILCSLWIGPVRLKVYCAGGKQTTCFELPQKTDNKRARQEIEKLSKIIII